ncbi:MAG: ComF family protein, partial [Fidelibacterota bacterium]
MSKVKFFSSGLLDIFFPPFCDVCGTRLVPDEKVVCGSCWKRLTPTDLGDWKSRLTHKDGLDTLWTGWFLDRVLRGIVYGLKYHERRVLATGLSGRLAKMFGEEVRAASVDVVVPVPLHPAKVRQRGFNQSDLLGKVLSSTLLLAYESRLLRRTSNTVSQTALSTESRFANVSGAFRVKDLRGYTRFLLVDDVVTSGATLSSCARALREAGGEYVAALTAGTPHLEGGKPSPAETSV